MGRPMNGQGGPVQHPLLIHRRDARRFPRGCPRGCALRHLILLAALCAPLPATAQDAFCQGLRTLAQGAANGFLEIPAGGRQLRGSSEEWRGTVETEDGPARGAYLAMMLTAPSRERANPAATRFRALEAEITRCLPQAQAAPAQRVDRGERATWTTSEARIVLRSDEGDGFASNAQVELAIVSRW